MKTLFLAFLVIPLTSWGYQTTEDIYEAPKYRYPSSTEDDNYEVKSPHLDTGYKVQEKKEEDGRSTASDEKSVQKWKFKGKMTEEEKKDLRP